jgi:hypothetical protein
MGAPNSSNSGGPTSGMDHAMQQNLSRAFLQSAVAQNMQIQQQLMAQNQALQQLLNTVLKWLKIQIHLAALCSSSRWKTRVDLSSSHTFLMSFFQRFVCGWFFSSSLLDLF